MKFPKTVYVKRETPENGDPYLETFTNVKNAAEDDEITLGVYVLSETKRVKKVVVEVK